MATLNTIIVSVKGRTDTTALSIVAQAQSELKDLRIQCTQAKPLTKQIATLRKLVDRRTAQCEDAIMKYEEAQNALDTAEREKLEAEQLLQEALDEQARHAAEEAADARVVGPETHLRALLGTLKDVGLPQEYFAGYQHGLEQLLIAMNSMNSMTRSTSMSSGANQPMGGWKAASSNVGAPTSLLVVATAPSLSTAVKENAQLVATQIDASPNSTILSPSVSRFAPKTKNTIVRSSPYPAVAKKEEAPATPVVSPVAPGLVGGSASSLVSEETPKPTKNTAKDADMTLISDSSPEAASQAAPQAAHLRADGYATPSQKSATHVSKIRKSRARSAHHARRRSRSATMIRGLEERSISRDRVFRGKKQETPTK